MSWYTEWQEIKSREIPEKSCSCGRKHYLIPEEAKCNEDGAFWNCECTSTLFYPNQECMKRIEENRKRKAA